MLRKSNIVLHAALLAVLLLPAATGATALRCDSGLVDQGDTQAQVRAVCGDPSFEDHATVQSAYGMNSYSLADIWYYNFGPSRLLYLLQFRAGRLQRLDTDGYGFYPPAAPDCDPAQLVTGVSSYRLLALCGEPTARRSYALYRPVEIGDRVVGQEVIVRQEWSYNFGPSRLQRALVLENGRVTEVKTEGYGH